MSITQKLFEPPGPIYPDISNSVYLGTAFLPDDEPPGLVGPPARCDLWLWRAAWQTVYCRWGWRDSQFSHEVLTGTFIQQLPMPRRLHPTYPSDLWPVVAFCRIMQRHLAGGDPDRAVQESGQYLSLLVEQYLGVGRELQGLWLMALEVQLAVEVR